MSEQTQNDRREALRYELVALAYRYGMRAEWHDNARDDANGGYWLVSGVLTVGTGVYGRLIDGARAYLDAAAASI